MWSHLFQSCMHLHMHCRALFLSSWWFKQINDVNFFDWNCDWFWRIITFACSTIFKFFFTTFLYSRSFLRNEHFSMSHVSAKFNYRRTWKFIFNLLLKNFRRTLSQNRRNSWCLNLEYDFWDFFNSLLKSLFDFWMTIASMLENSRVFVSWFNRRFSCI
jgi:hypothetical protein